MVELQPLNKYEKIRLRLKIMWEGGLMEYIDYGVASCLYNRFKEDFDEIYKYDKLKQTKKNMKELKLKIEKLTLKIETLLDGNIKTMNMSSIKQEQYNNIDLNEYNYILD